MDYSMGISDDIDFIMNVQSQLEVLESERITEANLRSAAYRAPGRWLSDSSLLVKRSQVEPPRKPRRYTRDESDIGDFRWKDYASSSQSSMRIPHKPTRRCSVIIESEDANISVSAQSIASDKWTEDDKPSLMRLTMPVRRESFTLLPDNMLLSSSNHSSTSITVESLRQHNQTLCSDLEQRDVSLSLLSISASDGNTSFRFQASSDVISLMAINAPSLLTSIEVIPDEMNVSLSSGPVPSSSTSAVVRSSPKIRAAYSA